VLSEHLTLFQGRLAVYRGSSATANLSERDKDIIKAYLAQRTLIESFSEETVGEEQLPPLLMPGSSGASAGQYSYLWRWQLRWFYLALAINTINCKINQACIGTNNDDRLIGTGDPDSMDALKGNDVLKGVEGDDNAMRGDQGNDRLLGGPDTLVLWVHRPWLQGPVGLRPLLSAHFRS
jgi:hypothetical protein